MTGLVRKAILFAAAGILVAGTAMASTPSATFSIVPDHINLVGSNGGVIDDGEDAPNSLFYGEFTITVNDLSNLPINNSFVIIDFSACSGLQICSDQLQAGITAVCGFQQVRGFTGPGGTLTLSVGGHANNTGSGNPSGDTDPNNGTNDPVVTPGCASVEADGTPIKSAVSVGAFDQDGEGLTTADQSCWQGDNFGVNSASPRHPHRSDFDGDGSVLTSDQSIWQYMNFAGKSGQNCGAPSNFIPQCAAIP
jgi:hypothetical protein